MTIRTAIGLLSLMSVLLGLMNQQASAQDVSQLQLQFFQQIGTNQYAQAELTARRMVRATEASGAPEANVSSIHALCMALLWQGKFEEAEKLYRQAIGICERQLAPSNQFRWMSYNMLGDALMQQEKYRDAEQWMSKALETSRIHNGAQSTEYTVSLVSLGQLFMRQRDYVRAEPVFRKSLEVARDSPAKFREQALAMAQVQLGRLYSAMSRPADSEPLLKEALRALEQQPFGRLAAAPALITSLGELGGLCLGQLRPVDAERYFRQAIRIADNQGLAESPQIVGCLVGLAVVCMTSDRSEEARELFQRVAKISGDSPGSSQAMQVWMNMLVLVKALQKEENLDQATDLLLRTLADMEQTRSEDDPYLVVFSSLVATVIAGFSDFQPMDPETLALADRLVERAIRSESQLSLASDYETRATLRWARGDREGALNDLRVAISRSDQLAVNAAGSGFDVARLFSAFRHPYDRMVGWQSELGATEEAFRAAERSRARVLMAEIQISGADLLSTVPASEAGPLERRRRTARQKLASLRHRASRQEPAIVNTATFQAELERTQQELVSIERDILSSSRAFRLALKQNSEPVALEALQDWVENRRALFLQYSFGQAHSSRIIVQWNQPPQVETVLLPAEIAQELNVPAGRMTVEVLKQLMQVDGRSLTELLADPELSNAAMTRLSILWNVLIPQAERERLVSGEYDLLVVSPDGPISHVPFETLVTEGGSEPVWLLDVGPPVLYCPSATVLTSLATRTTGNGSSSTEPVLSVSNPEFERRGSGGGVLRSASMQSKYAEFGGRFDPLPNTSVESNYLQQVFGKYAGVRTVALQAGRATEQNVRSNMAGRQIVHLATHGTSSQKFGNLFGALALTPGSDSTDPDDDGFLTLAEIPELDLASCELAILSACSTNAGPQFIGEGQWGLSRGFLAAGARRIVASNWVVDDQAAASLVSYFGGGVAQSWNTADSIDYPKSLHVAKRWVRDQDKWKSPCYWAPFVLIGTP